MERYDVRVLLNGDPMAMAPWHVPNADENFTEAACFAVFADDELAACEVTFAVCNSYSGEMHCDQRYRHVVAQYRRRKNRSLSIGDLVEINDTRYRCASVGFVPNADVERKP